MTRRAVVSVPGKLILMGEHAAVYGRPAVVTAAEPRARADLERADREVVVELADFEQRFRTSWREVSAHAARARAAWESYRDRPTPERFRKVRSKSPDGLVKVALGEAVVGLDPAGLPPIALRVRSDLPVGSGFGSSAATAVAVIGALQVLVDGSLDLEQLDRRVLEVERRQHGLPSGVDHKTIVHGGTVWVERRGEELSVSPLAARTRVLARFEVFQSGRPRETTGEVVAAVKRNGESRWRWFERLLDRMQGDSERFREQLIADRPSEAELVEVVRDYERCLEELGVVPASVREAIAEVEAVGGAAKISGAGALSGQAAGCLLVYWPDSPPSHLPTKLSRYRRQPVVLGAAGVQVERQE